MVNNQSRRRRTLKPASFPIKTTMCHIPPPSVNTKSLSNKRHVGFLLITVFSSQFWFMVHCKTTFTIRQTLFSSFLIPTPVLLALVGLLFRYEAYVTQSSFVDCRKIWNLESIFYFISHRNKISFLRSSRNALLLVTDGQSKYSIRVRYLFVYPSGP